MNERNKWVKCPKCDGLKLRRSPCLCAQASEEVGCSVLLARKDLHQLAGNLLQCAPLLRLMGEIEGSKTITTRKLMIKLHQVDDYLRLKAVDVAKMARMKDEVSS